MGSTFGQRDKNATNDMMGGQVVATGTPGATTVKDPNQGLDPEQSRNRKFLKLGGMAAGGLMAPASDAQSQGSPMTSGGGAGLGGFTPNIQPNMMPATPPPPPAMVPPVQRPGIGAMQNQPGMGAPRRLPFFGQ